MFNHRIVWIIVSVVYAAITVSGVHQQPLGAICVKKIDNVAAEQFTSITQKAWYNLILLSQSDVFGSCNQSILMNLCTALKFQKAERTVFYTVGCMPILFAAASIYLY